MTCTKINGGILCMGNIVFLCPKCGKTYSDTDEKYLDRCNRNQNGCARIKCECGQLFHMTYIHNKAISFLNAKLNKLC
jgi:hypothetical protein